MVVTEKGIGPVEIGMTVPHAEAMLKTSLAPPAGTDSAACRLTRWEGAPAGLSLMFEGGKVVRVDVDSGSVPTAAGAKIGTSTYTSACPYFYTCLSQTTTGTGRNKKTTTETVSAYEAAVAAEVSEGMSELRQKVPNSSLLAWAAPFNDAGQWTNLYNDPSGAAQAWLPGFMASNFPIVFTETNPVTYAQASGTVGSLTAYNRHYRFEIHTDTTIGQFAAALSDPAFAR
jgi:hypothetical protein